MYTLLEILIIFVISTGASFPWGELSLGRTVHGANCPWGELSVGGIVRDVNVRGASCPWGELSVGEMSVGQDVVGRVVVGRVFVGRVSMGRVSGNLKLVCFITHKSSNHKRGDNICRCIPLFPSFIIYSLLAAKGTVCEI